MLLDSKDEAQKDASKLAILTDKGQLTFEKWDKSLQKLVPG